MWKKDVLTWQETPDHPWDSFGVATNAPTLDDESDLQASALFIWKSQTIEVMLKKISDAIFALMRAPPDSDVMSAFVVLITALNLFPIYIKFIKDDANAATFLQLLQNEKGMEYFKKGDLEQFPDITYIVEYFLKNGLLVEKEGKYIIQGAVLTSIRFL